MIVAQGMFVLTPNILISGRGVLSFVQLLVKIGFREISGLQTDLERTSMASVIPVLRTAKGELRGLNIGGRHKPHAKAS